jgi:hypothetical protein
MNLAVDHLVVAASRLDEGVAWCEATLGITPGPGGRHALFGTHNRLFAIGDAAFPQAYFEIIAIDPEAPPPARPRWFGLDDAALQTRLAAGPRLVHFVARSDTLESDRRRLVEVGGDPGEPVHAWRDTPRGRLEWQILVRADGALPEGGALPTLIEWRGEHPTGAMPDSGVRLRSLACRGLPSRLRAALDLRGVTWAEGPGPGLRAVLSTPRGDLTLETP